MPDVNSLVTFTIEEHGRTNLFLFLLPLPQHGAASQSPFSFNVIPLPFIPNLPHQLSHFLLMRDAKSVDPFNILQRILRVKEQYSTHKLRPHQNHQRLTLSHQRASFPQLVL